VNRFSILIIRAFVGLAFAAILIRGFHGSIEPGYVVGLAAILVGLAYFSEYFENAKNRITAETQRSQRNLA
jgi:hypothetical protein